MLSKSCRDRKAYVIMHVQDVQSNVFLVRPIACQFFDFAKCRYSSQLKPIGQIQVSFYGPLYHCLINKVQCSWEIFKQAFPFSHYLAQFGRAKDNKYAKFIMEYYLNFGFKIQPVDRIFFFLQVKRTFLVRRVHQKLAFLINALNRLYLN